MRTSTPPAENLHAELARGQRLDRELAAALGRPTPARAANLERYVHGLQRRAPLDAREERELVAAAQRGDAAARARLVDALMPLIDAQARHYRGAHVQRLELLQEGVERTPPSLEEPVTGEEGAVGTLGELVADPLAEGEYERVLDAMQARELQALLAGLSDREREIVRARYGLDGDEESLRDVGARLGLSGERVRQIEQRALGKLTAAAS